MWTLNWDKFRGSWEIRANTELRVPDRHLKMLSSPNSIRAWLAKLGFEEQMWSFFSVLSLGFRHLFARAASLDSLVCIVLRVFLTITRGIHS